MDIGTIESMCIGEYKVLDYYEKYSDIKLLDELKQTLKKDAIELAKWMRGDSILNMKYYRVHNFVSCFNWFINHSNGTDEPCGLCDERFFDCMKEIRDNCFSPTDSINNNSSSVLA